VKVTRIGLDIAKQIFELHGVNSTIDLFIVSSACLPSPT